ncbi:TonB-dependent receptor [bacterium]|nr:TonB-dependent receptor [bacterium]
MTRKHRNQPLAWVLVSCAIVLMSVSSSFAGGGKISGTVYDSETGDPIMGANVTLEGTAQGAASDLDGYFMIVNVQAGRYQVQVTSIGYVPMIQTNVLVQSDLNTKLDFSLDATVLEAAEAVEVVYVKPVVELDKTGSVRNLSADDLSKMVVSNITDAIARQTGFTIDAEGNIHARGGRAEETMFMVDGMDIRDPLVGSQVDFDLNAMNVEELQVLTGGFNAEYGRAQSAIIKVTTREGDEGRYNGLMEYSTDNLIDQTSFNSDRLEAAFGGPVPGTKALLGKPITFFLSGNIDLTDTYTPFNVDRADNDYLGIGVDLPERNDNEFYGSVKLAYQLTDNKKLTLTANQYYKKWDIYPNGEGGVGGNYGWDYQYDTVNRPWAENSRGQVNLNYIHQLNDRSFYEVQAGRFYTESHVYPGGPDGTTNPDEFTLEDNAEDVFNFYTDFNGDGIIDVADTERHVPFQGFVDANLNGRYDGNGEGYEDLNGNGMWDRGEDWVDLNSNGNYDYAEPWTDRINPDTGENNVGSFDPWDDFVDTNNNGIWDGDEPQLAEQDWNGNGTWDGERFWDADGNQTYDGSGEGYYDEGYFEGTNNGTCDQKMNYNTTDEDRGEPFWDGDFYYDTGEPFIDTPNEYGFYNGVYDPGEIFFDLPSSYTNPFTQDFVYDPPTLNGQYDGPNSYFDEYEMFTYPNVLEFGYDPSWPVGYAFNPSQHGADWPGSYWLYQPGYSTWYNIKDVTEGQSNYQRRTFNPPNFQYDVGEPYEDYNGNGEWDGIDFFLNPGQWDASAYWYDRSTLEYNLKFDFTSQISKHHELKAGSELKYREMKMQSIQGPDQPYTNLDVPLPPGSPYPDRGDVRDFYEYQPWEGSLYIQDKMEFEGLIVNAGVRADFIIQDPDMVDESNAQVAADQPGALAATRGTYQIAPRLGISHPITDRSKLYFNYGHFYQAPQYQYFFKSNSGNIIPGAFVGNPNLEHEQTVQYALGVQTQVTDDLVFTVEGYYKDIYGLISTVPEQIVQGYTLDRYENLDYGRVRGFEISIDNNFSRNFSISFKWDFSYAFGKASSALAAQTYRLDNVPVNKDEHPLAWDETHKINVFTSLIYQKGEHPYVFGLKMPDNWLMTLEWRYGSGEPYTPSRWTTGLPDNQIRENSARYPWHEVTNLKFEKYFTLKGEAHIVAGLEVRNLFDSENVRELYTETGNAYDSTHPDHLNTAKSEPYPGPYDVGIDYDHNPRNYDPPRQAIFSLGITF